MKSLFGWSTSIKLSTEAIILNIFIIKKYTVIRAAESSDGRIYSAILVQSILQMIYFKSGFFLLEIKEAYFAVLFWHRPFMSLSIFPLPG